MTTALRYLIFFIELFLFTGFIWVIVSWFKKGNEIERWEMKFVKIAGLLFILAHLSVAIYYPPTSVLFSLIGLCFLLLSGILFLWSIKSFNQQPPAVAFAGTIIRPLNTNGAYKIIRHPFYTSYSLAWIGGTIATQCWYLIISFFCMFFIYWRAANLEETQWLNSSHADTYQTYMKATGMFFPKGEVLKTIFFIFFSLVIMAICIIAFNSWYHLKFTEVKLPLASYSFPSQLEQTKP